MMKEAKGSAFSIFGTSRKCLNLKGMKLVLCIYLRGTACANLQRAREERALELGTQRKDQQMNKPLCMGQRKEKK